MASMSPHRYLTDAEFDEVLRHPKGPVEGVRDVQRKNLKGLKKLFYQRQPQPLTDSQSLDIANDRRDGFGAVALMAIVQGTGFLGFHIRSAEAYPAAFPGGSEGVKELQRQMEKRKDNPVFHTPAPEPRTPSPDL